MNTKFGQLVDSGVPGTRDAFHVPAVLVTAVEVIEPGSALRFVDDRFEAVTPARGRTRHAIADPFLDTILPGDLFWALLVPNSVSNLVHHYELGFADVTRHIIEVVEPTEAEDDGCGVC